MKTAEHIIETVDKLVRKYHTRDPYELCQLLGIKIHYYDLQKKLKGFFYYQSRQKNIVIDHNVNGILERILVAHELGHAVLHTKIAMMHGFQEMEVFDDRSIEENEANFFAAELLLEDGKVLECLSEHTFFETAKMLYVPAALLDYKFSLLHEKGELVNSMYIRKADFLKEDLHAYDNDISRASRRSRFFSFRSAIQCCRPRIALRMDCIRLLAARMSRLRFPRNVSIPRFSIWCAAGPR